MTKSSWGTKRNCPACTVAFYDLNKTPATCPKCQHSFDQSVLVKPKRKAGKKAVDEKAIAIAKAAALKKIAAGKKSKKDTDEDDVGKSIGELMEMDDADDIENIHEFSELEEMEEESANEDDADEEALIEDLDTGDNVIVEDVEDEEAEFAKQSGEEEKEEVAKKKKKKK